MLGACSTQDEPSDTQHKYDSQAIYQNVVQTLYDNNGNPAYTLIGDGIYAGQADSAQASYDFIAALIGNKSWDNQDLVLSLGLNGDRGNLKIMGSTDALLDRGIYNEIIVYAEGYIPYTLQIITSQQADNGYGEDVFIKRIDSANN